jgi:hypothetical protein
MYLAFDPHFDTPSFAWLGQNQAIHATHERLLLISQGITEPVRSVAGRRKNNQQRKKQAILRNRSHCLGLYELIRLFKNVRKDLQLRLIFSGRSKRYHGAC